jgi:hypothetical protein
MHRRLRWQPSDCQLSLQGSKSLTWVETSRHRDKGSNQMTGATGDLCGRSECGAGQCKSRENRLGELNTDLHSFSPNHAATTDGYMVKHKIESIGNSDWTFHFEAGAKVRQVGDHAIDHRLATFEESISS